MMQMVKKLEALQSLPELYRKENDYGRFKR